MSSKKVVGLVLISALIPMALWAHHGTAGSYDQKKVVKVSGVVKEFRWRNPHSALFLDGKDEAGHPISYALEMGSPNTLVKMGYTRAAFKPGDQVEIEIHPSFTNPANGVTLSSGPVTVNGKQLKMAASGEAEY